MPEELLPGDVEQFSEGDLSQTDPEVVRALAAALQKARRYCGWHVSPVRTETLTVDGTGGPYLVLPTMKIVALSSIIEDGTVIPLTEVALSRDAPGVLARKNWRTWKCGFGFIEVTLTHGLTAAEAQDFRHAVLSLVVEASQSKGASASGALVQQKVDDVEYHWSDAVVTASSEGFGASFGQFRILPI